MSKFLSHPELILGPNPLLEAIQPFIPYAGIAEKLIYKPLHGINWREIPPSHRTPLLSQAEFHFVPTVQSIEGADAIQTLIRRSLSQRNPLTSTERIRINQLATLGNVQGFNEHLVGKPLDGGGGIFQGITGTGKTALTVSALQAIAPEQVIIHAKSDACGWSHLVQVVYLYVPFPPTGSKGGLFLRILEALDQATGTTSYRKNLGNRASLDSIITELYKALSIHRVALLIIDEAQEQSLIESGNFAQFALFFLNLMSLGISIFVVGNPNAFSQLSALAQLVRRFSVGGIHTFRPSDTQTDDLWRDYFVPGVREFCLVDQVHIDPLKRDPLEFKLCGGIPGLYRILWVESQRQCLRRAGDTAILTIEDIEDASLSPAFIEAKKIATSAVAMNQPSLFTDLPDLNSIIELSESEQDDLVRKSQHAAKMIVRQINTEKSQFGKLKARQKATAESFSKLSHDDLRRLGPTHELLQSLEKHVKKK